MSLRALWEWGFAFDGRRYPWGTHARDLPTLAPGPGEEHGLPAIQRLAYAAAAGPVAGVGLQIAADARLYEDEALAALRARLDADLGPGDHQPSPHGPEKANSHWRLDGATVHLTAYPSDWGFDAGRSSGRLDVNADRERLAAPFLPRVRAAGEPWSEGPLDFEVVQAPGLRDHREPPWRRDEIALALGWPRLRLTPAWLASRLGAYRVAIWDHAPSGTRGVSVDACTLPFPAAEPPVLRHIRWSRARGPGLAEIVDADGNGLLVTMPGPAGLDAVAERMVARGIPIAARIEEIDWG